MVYDIIIVGAGPAGLTAAIYGRRADKSVLVLEKSTFGGQITFSPKVENIPGFIEVTGSAFADKLVEQALELGAEVNLCEVLEIKNGETKVVVTDDGEYEAKAVIIATGAKHRMLGLEREQEFVGEGISFCAVCDGAFYRGRDVAVVGGGNSALQEALQLADQCKTVHVIQNLPYFTGEEKLVKQLRERENVTIRLGTVVVELVGGTSLSGVKLKAEDGTTEELQIDGLFVAVGLIPQNEPFAELIDLDGRGYADSHEDCLTKTEGIFVAGDCRRKNIRQLTTAFGDGAVAALAAVDYISNK